MAGVGDQAEVVRQRDHLPAVGKQSHRAARSGTMLLARILGQRCCDVPLPIEEPEHPESRRQRGNRELPSGLRERFVGLGPSDGSLKPYPPTS